MTKADIAITTTHFKQYASSTTHKIEAKEHDYLYIEESQIPGSGNGLYTAIPIYKEEVISIFKGKILTDKEAQHRAANAKDAYFINLPDGTIMDSMAVKCFAKYANDANGFTKTIYKNNSKISLDEDGKVCIVATKKISVGAEILCGYGNGYWRKMIDQMNPDKENFPNAGVCERKATGNNIDDIERQLKIIGYFKP